MGEDGHIASLFPSEPAELINSGLIYRPVSAAKPPAHRVTLDYAPLAVAQQVWVLASGYGKEQALRASIQAASRTPLGRLLALRRHTKIFTDVRLRD